jgi:hypothetical protein
VPFIRWGAATKVVVAAAMAATGLLLVLTGLYQIVKWRL